MKFKTILSDYLGILALFVPLLALLAFGVKGGIDWFTVGKYYSLTYLRLLVNGMTGVAGFFAILELLDYWRHRSKK